MGNIKGIALINLVKSLRRDRDEILPTLPEHLATYFDTRVLVSRWYPEDDFLALATALAQRLPDTEGDPFEWIGRQGARNDFGDTYSMMIRPGDPLETLQRYPRVWRLYHDAGRLDIAITGNTSARVEVFGTQLVTRPEFCRIQGGHLAGMLDMVGAEGVSIENLRIAEGHDPAAWAVRWG